MVGVKPKVTDIYPLSRFFSGFAFVYFAINMGGIATRHAMTPQELIRLFIALFLTLLTYSALRAIDIQRNQNRD